MSEDEWISLADAYAHVLEVRRLPERAHHELLEKLRSNEIGARAKSLKLGLSISRMAEQLDTPVNSYLFQAGHIDFAESSLTKPAAAGSSNIWTAHAVEARQIEVLRDEVLGFWPNKSKSLNSIKKTGGRPEEHNWPAAFAYCGWHVAQHGLPERKARLVELVTEWFEKQDGGAPKDPKEIGLRTSRAYDELSRLINGGKGV